MRPLIGVASSAFYDSFADTLFQDAGRNIVETCWQRLCLTGKMLRHIGMAGGLAELLSVRGTAEEISTMDFCSAAAPTLLRRYTAKRRMEAERPTPSGMNLNILY